MLVGIKKTTPYSELFNIPPSLLTKINQASIMKIIFAFPDDTNNAVISKNTSSCQIRREQMSIEALRGLGHEVLPYVFSTTQLSFWIRLFEQYLRLPGSTRLRKYTQQEQFSKCQRSLVAAARDFIPDIIILSDGVVWFDSVLLRLLKKSTSATIVVLSGTSPLMAVPRPMRDAAPDYDFVLCNDYYHTIQWKELGSQHAFVLPISGCDTQVHSVESFAHEQRSVITNDVCFIGRLTPSRLYAERVCLIEALKDFDLAIWTRDKEFISQHPTLARFYRGNAYGSDMVKALATSKVVLNFHGQTMQFGGNMRTFEIPAAGAFQIVDRYNPEWFVEGKEIVSFKNVADLRAKLRYYLEHEDERKAIATAGRIRAYRDHTYEKRMKSLIAIVTGTKK